MCWGIYSKPLYDKQLRKATKGHNFTLNGKKFKAKVVDVYDGDTCTVVFRYRGKLQQHVVRMMGYDSPEMRPPKNQKNREQEIKAANRAKDSLREFCAYGLVELHCHEFDKYGRLLATIYIPRRWIPYRRKVNVNQWMIDHNFGIPYEGGTKKKFSDQLLKEIVNRK